MELCEVITGWEQKNKYQVERSKGSSKWKDEDDRWED